MLELWKESSGADPWSARVPPDPLLVLESTEAAGKGVGCGRRFRTVVPPLAPGGAQRPIGTATVRERPPRAKSSPRAKKRIFARPSQFIKMPARWKSETGSD